MSTPKARVVDPNLVRKGRILDNHIHDAATLPNGDPPFSHVEFSITGLCNRACVFCPRRDPAAFPNRREYLSLEVYERVLLDLAAIGYRGGISYSGFSEPLYHKHLIEMIAMTKRIVPAALLRLNTNGDMLKPAKMAAIHEAGLDDLLISLYDGPEQHDKFLAMARAAGVPEEWVIMRIRYLPPEEGFGLSLSNRGGTLKGLEHLGVATPPEPLRAVCNYPLYLIVVDYDGAVLMCPHDWGKRYVVGNVSDESIIAIWSGERMNTARQRLMAADRAFGPCATCDVRGDVQGRHHFDVWTSHFGRKRS